MRTRNLLGGVIRAARRGALLALVGGMAVKTSQAEETLVHLKSGDAKGVSWALYSVQTTFHPRQTVAPQPTTDLVLVLRNTGSKMIDLNELNATNFTVRDAQQHELKCYFGTGPSPIGWDALGGIHLIVDHPASATEPWSLQVKYSEKHGYALLDFSITGISPGKATR